MTPEDFRNWKSAVMPAKNVNTSISGQSLYNKYNFQNPSFERNVRNGYEGNSLIAGAISFWLFAFGQAMFSTEDKNVLALLQNPNPEQSESDFKLSVMTNLLIGGNTYILGGKNSRNGVVQLWNYHSGLMQPLYNNDGFLQSYLYYNSSKPGSRREYAPEDVIHLKWLSRGIYNSDIGISPISQVFKEINLDNEVGRSVYNYLKNDLLRGKLARLTPGVDAPNKTERMAMKEAFIEQSTNDNKGMPIFLQDIDALENISGTFDELDTEGISKEAEARIANIFGVSPILLEWCVGLNKAIYNNVKEADKRFNTRKFSPLLDILGETLTHGFKNKFGFKGNYTIGFDKSRMESFYEIQIEKDSNYIEQYEKGAISFDEMREAIGREKNDESIISSKLLGNVPAAIEARSIIANYNLGEAAPEFALEREQAILCLLKLGWTQSEAEIAIPREKKIQLSQTSATPQGDLVPAITESITARENI